MRTRVFLALILCVAIAGGCRKKPSQPTAVALANKVSSRTVQLYFESPSFLLAPEVRTLSLPANDAAALRLVTTELLTGSANTAIAKPFPPDSIVRAAYLLPDGNAIIDLGGPTLTSGWNTGSHAEMIAIYSVVQTLTSNFPSVKRVRLLVNGQPVQTLAGHISTDKALVPMPSLLQKN